MDNEILSAIMIGEQTFQSVLKIQRKFRNYIWKKKLKRLKLAFERYYLRMTPNFLKIFPMALTTWASKLKAFELKFLNHRQMRLKKIRENLSIITLKKALKSKVLNIKAGRALYQKLQKRLRQQLSLVKVTDLLEPGVDNSPKQNIQTLMQELANESGSMTEEKSAQKALELSKLSYNIKPSADIHIVPLAIKKTYTRSEKISTIPYNYSNSSKPQPEIQKYRSLSIGTPPLNTYKRLYMSTEVPPKLMFYPIKDKFKSRPLSSNSKAVSEDMNFLRPTEFFMRKIFLAPNETKKKIKNPRPPSRKILRETFSSSAKRNPKKMILDFKNSGRRENRTSGHISKYNHCGKSFSNWKSFDLSGGKDLLI
jgi:hypothetical protein